MQTATATILAAPPWYRTLNKGQWYALLAANLGWMFDGYETYAVILTIGFALRELLDPSQLTHLPIYAGGAF